MIGPRISGEPRSVALAKSRGCVLRGSRGVPTDDRASREIGLQPATAAIWVASLSRVLVARVIQLAFLIAATMGTAILSNAIQAEDDAGQLSFNRDIRPILSENCMICHGPDPATREADLRLDNERSAHDYVLIPGEPEESELFRRITTDDKDELMPPVDSGRSLSQQEIELLRRWIEQGGQYQQHWSFITPVDLPLPNVPAQSRVANEIDAFVFSRLASEDLEPSDLASKPTLLRRVSLDLTGLPPTLDELEDFMADESPQAYEKIVDRLLASSRYGEHMTRYWLDAARYADPMASLSILNGRCGDGATGSSQPSITTCLSISSRLNNSLATCFPTQHWSNRLPAASIATT